MRAYRFPNKEIAERNDVAPQQIEAALGECSKAILDMQHNPENLIRRSSPYSFLDLLNEVCLSASEKRG